MSMSVAAVGGAGNPHIISGASGNMPPNQKMASLFNSIDTSGAGSINQAQFNQAFQTLSPPAVFKAQGSKIRSRANAGRSPAADSALSQIELPRPKFEFSVATGMSPPQTPSSSTKKCLRPRPDSQRIPLRPFSMAIVEIVPATRHRSAITLTAARPLQGQPVRGLRMWQ